jgi:methionyl-tRNA synthetase
VIENEENANSDFLIRRLTGVVSVAGHKPVTLIFKRFKLNEMKDKIEFSEFLELEKKLEIQVGTVLNVEDVPKSNKLLKLTVQFGSEQRTVVTNIKPHLTEPKGMENKGFLFITNLKPVMMMGIESTAMILPGEVEIGSFITTNGQSGTKIL